MRLRPRGAWLASLAAVRGVRRRVDPDLVHSHQLLPSGYLAELAGMRPHVATAWGSEVLLAGRIGRRLIRRVARGAELITADSHELLDRLEHSGAPRERLRWVPWGVDAAWREPAERLAPQEAAARAGLPADRPLVLFHRGVGRNYRPDTFVQAMALITDRLPEALGVVVGLEWGGAGAGTAAVRSLIAELGLDRDVIVTPPFPHEQMPFVYRASAVCVSIPESDSAPTSVFEALSLGTPAIVSELPWVREPVHEQARLSVVPGHDRGALADAIVAALSRPSADDAEANRRLVAEQFDRGRVFAEVDREYARLATGPN
jgi:glycosyltransferase involved in cell wall biosynthesis